MYWQPSIKASMYSDVFLLMFWSIWSVLSPPVESAVLLDQNISLLLSFLGFHLGWHMLLSQSIFDEPIRWELVGLLFRLESYLSMCHLGLRSQLCLGCLAGWLWMIINSNIYITNEKKRRIREKREEELSLCHIIPVTFRCTRIINNPIRKIATLVIN